MLCERNDYFSYTCTSCKSITCSICVGTLLRGARPCCLFFRLIMLHASMISCRWFINHTKPFLKYKRKQTLASYFLFLILFLWRDFYRARRDELEKTEAPAWKVKRWRLLKPLNSKVYWLNHIYGYDFVGKKVIYIYICIITFSQGEVGVIGLPGRDGAEVSWGPQGQTWQTLLETEKNTAFLISCSVFFWINKSFNHSGKIRIQRREGSFYILLIFLNILVLVLGKCPQGLYSSRKMLWKGTYWSNCCTCVISFLAFDPSFEEIWIHWEESQEPVGTSLF